MSNTATCLPLLQPNIFEDEAAVWAVIGNTTLTAAEKVILLALFRDVFDDSRELPGIARRVADAVGCDDQTVRRAITRLSGRDGLFIKRIAKTLTQYGWENYIDLQPRYADLRAMMKAAGELQLVRPQWGGYRMSAS
jgi:hypothetical protein